MVITLDVKDVESHDYVDLQIEACDYASKMKDNPVTLKEKNFGEIINNKQDNFNALISGDMKNLVFMSSLKFYDGIFYSQKVNNKWQKPENITSEIGSDGDLYCTGISFLGDELFMYKREMADSDIYVSKLKDGKWTKAEKLGKNVNTKYWESHASISSDGKILYFTSNRNGGYGSLDIYKSERDEDGQWGVATNLGPTVNTPFNEETPYSVNNGNSLYFSSQGHSGMGGFDVFYTNVSKDGEWTVPVNLGYPINTTNDDLHYVPLENGIKGLCSRIKPTGYGKRDLYLYEIFSKNNPRQVEIKGKMSLHDNRTDFNKNFIIKIINLKKKDTVAALTPVEETGVISYVADAGDYKLVFTGKGYESVERQIMIPYDYPHKEYIVEAELKPIEMQTDRSHIMKSILFRYNDYNLTRNSKVELERLLEVMKTNPSLNVQITGHADSKGNDQYNLKLSEKRARSVIEYLSTNGINKNRIQLQAVGENQHIAINVNPDGTDNPEGRKYNRRVDINMLNSEPGVVIVENINVPKHLQIKKHQQYMLLLAANDKKLPENYFSKYEDIDMDKITISTVDNGYFYSYGPYLQEEKALNIWNRLTEQGLSGARVISVQELSEMQKDY